MNDRLLNSLGDLLEIVKHGNRIQPGNGWLQDRDGRPLSVGGMVADRMATVRLWAWWN
ncbi:MAG TPA: hypothetical protein VFR79_02435 [Nitrospira sp.]|nr:hypothetical protein [Nitrospira sp.]